MTRWLFALLALCALHAHAQPRRIVSLLPSLTETVCVLGHCSALVAVDDFSNWPDSVKRLPHVGGLEDANIERIVALKPDLVLLTSSSRAAARLQALGIQVVAMEPKTLDDVRVAFEKVGALLGEAEAAKREWMRMNDGIAQAAHAVPASRKGVRVYFEVDSGPYAAGEISHIGELLKRLGAANIVPASLGSVPKLNPEFVVRADPQVIMIGAREAAEMRRRPGWERISAIREGRVCTLDSAQGDVVARPGPRLADAARILAGCLSR
ncbi:ABC transporter substrate-binding protein [Ramlibacter sp. PS4R-6]|uniref:ABC transporter substrate-binding protein n=1 Tax=Ramlibacter sp. PS4R-6 TaxID=3133438 RepID=UPI0030A0D1D9